MPGYMKFVLYPHDMADARRLIAEAHPSDRKITVWTLRIPVERRAAACYRKVLLDLGVTVHLKVVKPSHYVTVIGKPSTPDLDTGLGNWFADYPHPNDFFESLLASWSICPTFNETWRRSTARHSTTRSSSLGKGVGRFQNTAMRSSIGPTPLWRPGSPMAFQRFRSLSPGRCGSHR